jgi:hypothetical protein
MGETREIEIGDGTVSIGSDRRDNLVQAGLDPDQYLRFEKWRRERGISKSEAVRRLLRDGLETGSDRLSAALGVSLFFGVVWAVAVIGVVWSIGAIGATLTITTIVGGVHIGAIIVITGWPYLKQLLPLPQSL